MRKFMTILMLFMLIVSCTAAETPEQDINIIGGADSPTDIFVSASQTDDSFISIDGTMYYNTRKQMPVEPDSSVIEYIEMPFGTDSANKPSAWARLSDGSLVVLIEREWYLYANAVVLPSFHYQDGGDPIEGAVVEYSTGFAQSYLQSDCSVVIPAPVILKTEITDENHAKVYGVFWVLNYVMEDDILLCVSGGAYPGMMTLVKTKGDFQRTDDEWEVEAFDAVGDGEDYVKDIKRLSADDRDLENAFFSASSDISAEPTKQVRYQYIYQYVTDNNLPIYGYGDQFWTPIRFTEE